ncbi:sugar phosphate isomerase/epimerase [Weissella coleopterorum]|uniref:Sugar phosphate isomerase/epimerase n=1 Tax=Weissella coleopterorum TaxID=2714949 RepID=A0A6G8AZ91_9LACO|nr:TIM barrel protein [Weissella coleopterorum]QIL50300.1 sugar phosphate isomerase/epimerase [Weissella coleopterorum]
MINSNLVLNNLVFASQREQGMQQTEMLQMASNLKISAVELRREYFDQIKNETSSIQKMMLTTPIRLFYSVPDELFVNGKLNPRLEQYFHEAQQLGIYAIKFNIGEFQGFNNEIIAELKKWLMLGIQINVENDQTQTSGRLAVIKKFMDAVAQAGLDLGYVYDMGNWRFVGDDELEAAKVLAKYVRYIHVKDGTGFKQTAQTVLLGAGEIMWQNILEVLPQTVPVALEYPTADLQILQKGISMLNDNLGAH